MKRSRLGWPPNSHVKKADSHARTIEDAIRSADAGRKPIQVDHEKSADNANEGTNDQ